MEMISHSKPITPALEGVGEEKRESQYSDNFSFAKIVKELNKTT